MGQFPCGYCSTTPEFLGVTEAEVFLETALALGWFIPVGVAKLRIGGYELGHLAHGMALGSSAFK